MTDEIVNTGPGPAEQRMRVFISFAEGEEEFADYLGYVLTLRGFELSTCSAPRFRRRIIGKTEASIFVLTAAAAASKRVIGELAETVHQSKPALVLVPGALSDVAIPAEFSAHPFIHSWRNPDVANSSLVNGLLALEQALDEARLTRPAPASEILEQALAETTEPAVAPAMAAESELVPQQAEPAAQQPAAFSIEALTSAFAESVPDPFAIAELPADFVEPAISPETIAAELIAEPLLASAPALEPRILEPLAKPLPEPLIEHGSEFIFETLAPQADPNPHLHPVFQIKLEPTYEVLDLTLRAEDIPLLPMAQTARPLPPLALPRLVSSQPAPRVQPKPPALIDKGQGGNARRRSVAHLAIVTASLMCAAANAPWLISFLSSARAAAAEERARPPSAPSLRPSVTIRNSEPEIIEPAEAAFAPASEPEAVAIETTTPEPEAIEPGVPAVTPEAAPAPAAAEVPAEPLLTDAELAQQLDHDDWLEARKIGNLAAFRAYIEKHADGVHYAEAMDRARRRIAELSTNPVSTLVYLTGPAFFRGLPTRDIDGLEAGARGQDVYIIDRIATRREGDWLVFERGGAWPFLFVNAPEVEKAETEKKVE